MTGIVARICFWISLGLGILGHLITFYPGAELQWFALAAALALPGFLIPKWSFQSASLVMLILWSGMAIVGYKHGKQYSAWLQEKEASELSTGRAGLTRK